MKQNNLSKKTYYKTELYAALLTLVPVFLYHFCFVVLPSVNSLVSSFTNWNGLLTKKFIGLKNYQDLFNDPDFYEALLNNIKWMLVFITLPVIFSVLIGFMLSHIKKGQTAFRVMYFLPYVISAAIAGKIFAAFYNPYLGINGWLKDIGMPFLAHDWLAPEHSLMSVAFVDMWHWWGFLLVIFMSALQQIDPMLYESAEIEGASELQKLRYITIPGIKRTLTFIILVSMVWSIGTFDYVWVMTKGSTGSSILSTMLYKNAFLKYKAGYACTISVFQNILALLIFGIFNIIQKRSEDN